MLNAIFSQDTSSLAVSLRQTATAAAGSGMTSAQASAVAVMTEDTVTVSLSPAAITASFSSTTIVATANLDSGAQNRAEVEAQRGQEALSTMVAAKGKAAKTMKGFLRQKLDSYKKQLQILRILGTDAMDIAKGAVRIARGVAGAARDYAAAPKTEQEAGIPESASESPASAGGTGSETVKQAQSDADALKAKANAAPLSAGVDNPSDAPTDPDERFFYDAYRIMGLAKKTLVQAERVDTQLHGFAHAKEFKKLRQREGELEDAVTKSYIAMKTGGDLKAVDALLKDNSSDNPAISALI